MSIKDMLGCVRRFSRKYNRQLSIAFKITKIFVFISLIYTSLMMYRLDNNLTSIILLFTAALFLILNKLDSMI